MSENEFSKNVLDAIELAGWQNNGVKANPFASVDKSFTAEIIDPNYNYLQDIDTGFTFDGTSNGLSNAIKEKCDELNSTNITELSHSIADKNNADLDLVRNELLMYSNDLEQLYTCVEFACIKDEIQELRDEIQNLYEHKDSKKEQVTDKANKTKSTKSNPER